MITHLALQAGNEVSREYDVGKKYRHLYVLF